MIVSNVHPNHATLRSLLVAIYVSSIQRKYGTVDRLSQEVGCLIGALSNLWVGDRLGRRRTIILGGILMITGAILQATSFSYAQIIVARIVTGLGNGLNVGFESYKLGVHSNNTRHQLSPRIMPNAPQPRTVEA